jgi:hypothetical protein
MIMATPKQVWITSDGRQFETQAQALDHEKAVELSSEMSRATFFPVDSELRYRMALWMVAAVVDGSLRALDAPDASACEG